MKRLNNNLSAVFFFLLLAAWACSTGELVRATCSTGCSDKCFAATGWCQVIENLDGHYQHQYASAVVQSGCTDGKTGGTPAVNGVVSWDFYNDCTADCTMYNVTSQYTAAYAGKKTDSGSGTYKTQCNTSSSP
jgi:hypothetical protein